MRLLLCVSKRNGNRIYSLLTSVAFNKVSQTGMDPRVARKKMEGLFLLLIGGATWVTAPKGTFWHPHIKPLAVELSPFSTGHVI